MTTIAFLGLGAMGLRMATNLQVARHKLRVYNRSPDRCPSLLSSGAALFSTPRETAQNADIVFSMVTDDKASQAIWLDEKSGAVLGLQQSTIAIECSTLSVSWCKTLAKKIATKGATFIDAPVVGSRPQAEAKQLIHLVGGEQTILEQVRDILNTSAVIVHHVGKTRAGMSMKLAVNALFGIQTAALAEILGLLSKAGIPKDTAVSLLNNLPTTSPALKGIGTLIADENYAPLFPINLVEKDFCYLEELATSVHARTPSATLVRQIYQQAKNSGYSEHNIAGIAQLY